MQNGKVGLGVIATTEALAERPSAIYLMASAPAITWLLVTICPEALRITPEPSERSMRWRLPRLKTSGAAVESSDGSVRASTNLAV